jgi:hypothetical protein
MRLLKFFFCSFLTILFTNTYNQSLVDNTCDSATLTMEELEKCLADKAFYADILITTNYIIKFKTALLPKYRIIRNELTLPDELQNSLKLLKITYDSVVNAKIPAFQAEMSKNQKHIQPKAYLASLISLETFRIYPDVYAILLNDIHLLLSPRTSIANLNSHKKLVEQVFNTIPIDLHQRLEEITTSLVSENEKLKIGGFSPIFQGRPNQGDLEKYQIINFLVWEE